MSQLGQDGAVSIFTATVLPAGNRFAAPANQTLLQSAELANTPGLKLDSSCRNGTCRTCICRLVSGEVTYQIEWPGLSLDEKRDGYILPCAAYPASDVMMAVPM